MAQLSSSRWAAARMAGSWFVVQRQIAVAGSPLPIVAVASNIMQATGAAFSTTRPTAVTFTTTGSLPTSSPQIVVGRYYWAVGYIGDTFFLFENQEDAVQSIDEGMNVGDIFYSALGSNSHIIAWPPTTIFTMEELTEEVFLDCAVQYVGAPDASITTGALFNAQDVKMVGDGFGFDAAAEVNVGNQVLFEAHGSPVLVSEAFIGFPINTIIEPMPLNISSGPSAKESSLTKPQRVEWVRFMFNNTIGGTINGIPIALEPFDMAHIGEPPFPGRGVFEMSIMRRLGGLLITRLLPSSIMSRLTSNYLDCSIRYRTKREVYDLFDASHASRRNDNRLLWL